MMIIGACLAVVGILGLLTAGSYYISPEEPKNLSLGQKDASFSHSLPNQQQPDYHGIEAFPKIHARSFQDLFNFCQVRMVLLAAVLVSVILAAVLLICCCIRRKKEEEEPALLGFNQSQSAVETDDQVADYSSILNNVSWWHVLIFVGLLSLLTFRTKERQTPIGGKGKTGKSKNCQKQWALHCINRN